MRRRIAPWVASLVVLASPARARAAPAAEADVLFEEGRALLDAGAFKEACPKLERSFQLAPRLGTMLNLGACFEGRGQLARALTIYESAATLARQTGRADREATAREYAAALEPRVAKLLLVLEEPSADLAIQVDGEALSARSGLIPVDPGARRLTARRPGRVAFELRVALEAGRTTTVRIPRLAPEAPARVAEPEAGRSPVRTGVLVGGVALGAIAIGAGTALAISAAGTYAEAERSCDGRGCDDAGLAGIDDARKAGDLATATFAVGGAALAATVLVYLLWPSQRPTRAAALRF